MSNSLLESYIHVGYENKKILIYFFFVFVNYVNIAFQQAIGHYLTPFGRGERAI